MNIGMTLLGQALSFALLIWFSVKFIWPPLTEAVRERQQKIADSLAAAEKARAEVKDASSHAEEELRAARLRASEIIDRAQQQGNEIIAEARGKAVEEIDRLKAQAQDDIALMAEKAREDLRKEVSVLAVKGAEKIVAREINPAVHKDILDQLAAEI